MTKITILVRRQDSYDFFNHPLYVCESCQSNLESISFTLLKFKWNDFYGRYGEYVNWSLGNARGSSPNHTVIRLPFSCNCARKHIAVFAGKYQETNFFDAESLSLINVIGSKPLNEVIHGVYTKTNIMVWLYKLLARWNFLYGKIYIITPFVGHQFLDSKTKVSTWLKIIGRLDPQKSVIMVRNGQKKIFQKAFSASNAISYEDMERDNLGSSLVSEIKSRNNFHAKIYCAVSADRCEIMNGSSNLVEGPSYEVINFDTINEYSNLYQKFLNPLGVPNIANELQNTNNNWSLVFDEKNNFNASSSPLNHGDYINFTLNNCDIS